MDVHVWMSWKVDVILEHTTRIRSELEKYIKRKGMTNSQFAEKAGINPGTISAIINGTRPIAMRQLDLIIAGMDLEEGSLYDLYIDDSFIDLPPNWRRLQPLLYRCAELNKLDCMRRVLGIVMDNLSYLPGLFDTAEEFYALGYSEAAIMLYKMVAEGEKYQHSERLAVCQYRLFLLMRSKDQRANLRIALHFEAYLDRLSDEEQLDALIDLMNLYASLDEHDRVIELADIAIAKAKSPYVKVTEKNKRPYFAYEPSSYLMKAGAYGRKKEYEKALHYTRLYGEMEFPEPANEVEEGYIKRYREWALSNTYALKLLMGKEEVLQDYIDYLKKRKADPLPVLFTIIQSANLHDFNIDEILVTFEHRISNYLDEKYLKEIYEDQADSDRLVKFLYELGLYYLKHGQFEDGLNYVLNSLANSIKINSDKGTIRSIKLFEKYRDKASISKIKRYSDIIEEVQE